VKIYLETLGCARNETDSEELAARLDAAGFEFSATAEGADLAVVNTCGFIDAAKKDSIDRILELSEDTKVVAVGCLAERYGSELAEQLPEAAVLGFDDYPDIAQRLASVLAGDVLPVHKPSDRRLLLPVTPVARPAATAFVPGHGEELPPGIAPASGPVLRKRLSGSPSAPLKIASGCDRHCAFCAIPSFRGSYLSRPIDQIAAEAQWLAEQGVKEAVLVSENSTSYGKDIHTDLVALLEALEGTSLEWIRVSYLQPAELKPQLISKICSSSRILPYFDLPFQHASGPLLRRMRRFGDAESFLGLLERIRKENPEAAVRSNFIVGFPGETEEDLQVLADFLSAADLDAVGVFGFSDEEGTEGNTLSGKVPEAEIAERVEWITSLVDELIADKAASRIGERHQVLVEGVEDGKAFGRAEYQGPDDGICVLDFPADVGALVWGRVSDSNGVDLSLEA
jgi:ribosomal protein S12 methylthiotransferase RimO